jgi:hypothetical protein
MLVRRIAKCPKYSYSKLEIQNVLHNIPESEFIIYKKSLKENVGLFIYCKNRLRLVLQYIGNYS